MKKNDRRKALKALAVGAPAVWAKPVVDGVVLPAHAATTCPDCFPSGDGYVSLTYIEPCGDTQRWALSSYDDPECKNLNVGDAVVGPLGSGACPTSVDCGIVDSCFDLPCGRFGYHVGGS